MTVVRSVAHVHSDWSDDGSWSLQALADAFRRRRAQVVLMAEHSRGWTADRYQAYLAACDAASGGGLLLVPGIEYNDPDDVVHVPVWGPLPFFGATPEIGRLLADVSAAGGTSVLAHPWRRDAWRRVESSWLAHLRAVEIWNRKYDGWAPSREAVEFARAAGLPAFAGLDFHTRRQFFPLTMSIDVGPINGGTPSRDAVFAALRDGSFRALAFRRPARALTAEAPLRALERGERARKVVARQLRRVTG
jgi:hypothetical protein